MALDPSDNFAETELSSGVNDTTNTFPVVDATVFPNADTEGAFNVLVWNAEENINPVEVPTAEFVRVTSVDTTNDELTVQRGQEDTTAAAHPGGSTVADTWTAKDRGDIQTGLDGKAADPHGNEAHSSTFETESGAQTKADNAEASAESYADTEIENHRTGETHTTEQPPQTHDNSAHNPNFATTDEVGPAVNRVYKDAIIITGTGNQTINGLPFRPNAVEFQVRSANPTFNNDVSGTGDDSPTNYIGSTVGFARQDGASIVQQTIHSGGSGNSINNSSFFASDSLCIGIRFAGQNGGVTGRVEASLSEFTSDGFTLSVNQHDQNVVVIYTAYRTGEVTNDLTDLSHDQLIDIDPGDHHSRYTDSEASAAAPVQDVEGKTGNVTLGPGDVEAEPSGSVEDHRQNETHATAQPPETHGDTEHDNTVPSQSDVDAKADNPHGNAAHTTNFVPSSDVTDIVVDQTNKVINFKTT